MKHTPTTSRKMKWVMPIFLAAFILVLSFFPSVIEKYYSTGFYQWISKIFRTITGVLPFSIGDVLYIIATIYLIKWIVVLIVTLFKRQASWKLFGNGCLRLLRKFLWIYIWFNIAWGLNYSREGIAYQLKLEPKPYSKQEVESLTCDLIEKVNDARRELGDTSLKEESFDTIFTEAQLAYDSIAMENNFLEYRHASIKKSIFSPIAHYLGFTGYYNPFTSEAQVRYDVPRILIPYITCHEMAHQLGYASESEANFVGYLAASHSKDAYFRYSVYMDLYRYAAVELFLKDFKSRHGFELDSLVRKDMYNINAYFMRKQNRISPLMNSLYDQYLKANKQAKGIDSYDEVVGWLIDYRKKFGKL